MEINMQLFGGRGAMSGGNFRGNTKPPSSIQQILLTHGIKMENLIKSGGMINLETLKWTKIIPIMVIIKSIQ